VPAPKPADLALDAALLVGAVLAGEAVERIEPVVRTQRHETGVFEPVPAKRDPGHRRFEVVVADHADRYPAEGGERPDVAVEERFLGLVGVGEMERLARMRQAHAEHEYLHHHPGNGDGELAEVDLGLLGRRMSLRHHHLFRPADLGAELGHQVAHARLGHLHSFLLHQALPHAASGVTLLARRLEVLGQPTPDRRLMRTQNRRLAFRGLTWWRHRIGQRRAHRTAVHLVPSGERPDGQAFVSGVSSDTFELLHSRSLLQPLASRERLWSDDTKHRV